MGKTDSHEAYDYMTDVHKGYDDAIKRLIDENGNSADGITANDAYNEYQFSITGGYTNDYSYDTDTSAGYVKDFMFTDEWNGFIQWLIVAVMQRPDNSGMLQNLMTPENTDIMIRNYLLNKYSDKWFNEFDSDSYIIENINAE